MIFIRSLFCLLFATAMLALPSSFRRWTHPFNPEKNALEWPANPEWELSATEMERAEIARILNQPYYYLGKGIQSYAFASQDGEYVVKLFRTDACRVRFGQRLIKFVKNFVGVGSRELLPLQIRTGKIFRSCVLAYKRLKEETGLVWVNLNPKQGEWPQLQLRDRLGRWHTVDTGRHRFLIQKKADSISTALNRAHEAGAEQEAELARAYVSLQKSMDEKGVYNTDPKMFSNYGFVGKRAVQIDVGSLTDDMSAAPYRAAHFLTRFQGYLQKRFPEAALSIEEELSGSP